MGQRLDRIPRFFDPAIDVEAGTRLLETEIKDVSI